ncbi:hypothetical protein G6F52_014113 [Rhizopus delemar]|nr:hypothetical protein G6F52_014113 [Rhizopus delemar]
MWPTDSVPAASPGTVADQPGHPADPSPAASAMASGAPATATIPGSLQTRAIRRPGPLSAPAHVTRAIGAGATAPTQAPPAPPPPEDSHER